MATGWSVYSGNIYVADVGTSVARVFVDNAFYTIAHYPNTGYETITSNSADKVSLTSTSFSPPSSDLVGAGVAVRTVSWRIEEEIISAYDSSAHKISWTGDTIFSILANYGFYLTNKLWMLDQAGEWYYDSSAGKLYVWLSDSSNPSGHSISVSTASSLGIVANNKNYFVIQDITVRNTGSDGVQLNTTTNVTLQRLNVTFAGHYGIYASGSSSDNLVFDSNTISKALKVGIELSNLLTSSATISNNTVSDTGNFGLPIRSDAAIYVIRSNNVHVQGNTVSGNSYDGIRFETSNNILIQNNIVSNSCLVLDDCGGIVTSGSQIVTGNQILSNIVTDSIGNYIGTPYTFTQAEGIYLDDSTNNITVSGNTISNIDSGIYLHNSYSDTVTNNTVYKARVNGLWIKEDSNVSLGTIRNNTISGNIFLNNSNSYPSAEFDGTLGSVNFGSYNLNNYFSTYFGYPVSQRVINTTTNYSLADWRTVSGQDAQSSDIGSFFSASKVDAYLGSNLVTNSTFDSTINNWHNFSSDNSTTTNWVASCGLDGGCLHVTANIISSLAYTDSFSIQSGTVYEVSFSIISNGAYSGTVLARKATSPFTSQGTKSFTTSSTRQDISFTFTASTSLTNDARIDFNTNVADYYIDNVSIRPVTLHNTSNDSVLYTNSTSNTSTVNLGGSKYCDVNNNAVSGSFSLASFSSKILLSCFNNSDSLCNNHETHDSASSDCPGTSDEGTSAGLDASLTMGSDKPDIASNIRLYSQGKFRNILTPSGTTADLTITPPSMDGGDYSQYMDLVINTWSNTGVRHKQWTESSSTIGSASTLHTVGDLTPYNFYYVSVDSNLGSSITGALGISCLRGVCQANSQGKISFTYSGGYSTHTFDITQGMDNTSPSSPWTQSDWSGGSGQTNWSDATKFSSSANVTTSTPNQITLSSVEKFSNTTFDTDLTGWSGTQNYTLNDAFTTNRSAGAVNGTSSEPTGGTRTVTDTNTKISVGSGTLNFATGAAANDAVWWPSTTRTAGRILIGTITPADLLGVTRIGWDTNQSGALVSSLTFNTGTIYINDNVYAPSSGTFTATNYNVAAILRTSGYFYFIKGGTYANWTLLGTLPSNSTSPMFPVVNVGNTTASTTFDNIRIPSSLWLPTPLAYDTFTTNGAASTETSGPDAQTTPSLAWTNSIGAWQVTSGVASASTLSSGAAARTVNSSSANILADVAVTRIAGNAGWFFRYQDANNYLIAYHDGTNAKVDKVVGGVTTNVISTAATYSAGAVLRIVADGTAITLYYNNVKIGSTTTVTNFSTATIHGLYTTDTNNTLDNFTIWPRGTGGEYNAIPAEDLTTTVDATHTRGSSTGAAKLIAAGNNSNFYQNVNLGNTNTYNMVAYVYKDGTAVSASDTQLIANGTLVSTTYTADSNNAGWYKLSGTVTGTPSSIPYGIQVIAGKTVWVDDMSLKLQSLTGTLTSSIFDGGDRTSWGSMTYTATTPTNTSVSVKVFTSSSPTISTDFSSCTAISSGSNISTGGCDSGGEYAQYQVTLSSTDSSQTPTFSSITINFTHIPFPPSGPPTCSSTIPTGTTPWLYGASANSGNSITLKFTNWQSPVDHFALEYGTSPNNYQYAADNIGGNGTNSYTVNSLNPNTTYYFRVRAGNGCATGSWSNEISAKTLGLYTINNLNIVSSTLSPVTTPIKPEETTPNSCKTYTVKGGDTLWSIAASQLGGGAKFQEIIDQNKNTYPSISGHTLSVGWKLKLNCDQANNQSATNSTTSGYEVKVKVIDTKNNLISGVKVTLHSTPKDITTDKNGIADFTNIEAGEHNVLIAYNGYTGQQTINLSGNEKVFNLTITIKLQNPFLTPLVIITIGILVLIIAFLTFKLIKKNKIKGL